MSRKLSLLTVLAAASLGLGLAGCEMNEACDPATDPECVPTDTGGDTTTDTGQDVGQDVSQFQTYHYVLVEDLDTSPAGDRPGADIDAVELRSGNQSIYLSEIREFNRGAGEPPANAANRNFNNALGAPQRQCVGLTNPRDWDPTTFVSLGGVGGYFIAQFTNLAEIRAGDRITVHACAGAQSEQWEVTVGVASALNSPTWQQINPLGRGVGTADFTVPNLPNIPRN
jgi:hypothetical protein